MVPMIISATGSERSPRLSRARAFTLIELSVVVFIMAMLAIVAIPSFVRSYNASQLSAAGPQDRHRLPICPFEAVLHQQNVTLSLDADQKTVSVTAPVAAATPDDSPGSATKVIPLPRLVTVASVELSEQGAHRGNQVAVQFYPNGTADYLMVVLRGAEKNDVLAVTLDPVTARATPTAVK